MIRILNDEQVEYLYLLIVAYGLSALSAISVFIEDLPVLPDQEVNNDH